MKIGIFYHGNCADGFTAAWVVYNKYIGTVTDADILLVPCTYGEDDLIVSNIATNEYDLIYMVDFSVDPDYIDEICGACHQFILIDHHKTAAEKWGKYLGFAERTFLASYDNATILYEQEESGASLTYKWLHSTEDFPPLIRYVKDRDLWIKELPYTEEVSAVISVTSQTIDHWNTLANELAYTPHELHTQGAAILAYKEKLIESIIRYAVPVRVLGVPMLYVECPQMLASDLGNELAAQSGSHISLTSQGDKFSLRSIGETNDITSIAQYFGGGGHATAAGFYAPHEQVFGNAKSGS